MSETAKVTMTPTKPDYFVLVIDGVVVGEYERSAYRQILEVIDDAIGVGLKVQNTEMSSEEFAEMVKNSREAALSENDEDCLMCGS